MSTETAGLDEAMARAVAPTQFERLRGFSCAAGVAWAVAFAVIGPTCWLQTYGDGSMFSYAVAVEDAWAFHWHNIAGRAFVYFVTLLPAETYVALTRDATGGVVLYGVLFCAAPLAGLAATWATDRSPGRVIFAFACASTACLCPFVFGFPTEVWVAHAVFWPTLALVHDDGGGLGRTIAGFVALLALAFSYEGGLVLGLVIVATLALRGRWSRNLARAGIGFAMVLAIWWAVHMAVPPDDYFGPVLARAARHVFDLTVFTGDLMRLVYVALAVYAACFVLLRRIGRTNVALHAAAIVALALSVWWLALDTALHAENRYYLRTLMLVLLPALGVIAAVAARAAWVVVDRMPPWLARLVSAVTNEAAARAMIGALAVLMLVHAVETAKFVTAWTEYRSAVRALAMGTISDPALGDPRFVSSARLGTRLNRLAWFSTTPYLSILLAPGFAPARLVIDPAANYFWLSCETATHNAVADRAVPASSRQLVRVYSCLHR